MGGGQEEPTPALRATPQAVNKLNRDDPDVSWLKIHSLKRARSARAPDGADGWDSCPGAHPSCRSDLTAIHNDGTRIVPVIWI